MKSMDVTNSIKDRVSFGKSKNDAILGIKNKNKNKIVSKLIIIIFIFLIVGCSFRKKEQTIISDLLGEIKKEDSKGIQELEIKKADPVSIDPITKKPTDEEIAKKQLEAIRALVDSDQDGIPDELEIRTGTNPNIADIPSISISLVQDISIGAIIDPATSREFSMLRQTFTEQENRRGGDLELLKVLRRKVIKNQYNHLRNVQAEKIDFITNDDLRVNILSSWTDDLYYSFMDRFLNTSNNGQNSSGKFVTNFKVKIKSAKNVTEISDISLKSFFYDYQAIAESEIYNHYLMNDSGIKEKFTLSGSEEFEPVTRYSLIANELSSFLITGKISNRSEIGIKFTDYNYITLGIPHNYAETLNKVFNADAKIIYSDGVTTEVYFVSPTLSLGEALEQLGKKVNLVNDRNIYSINGIESTATYPIDLDNLTIDDVKKGIWSLFGDGDSFSDQLKPKGLYVVGYSTVGEILASNKKWEVLSGEPIVDSMVINNVYNGDELLIEMESVRMTSLIESVIRKITPSEMRGAGCNFVDDPLSGPGSSCTIIPEYFQDYANSSVVVNNISLSMDESLNWLSFVDSYGTKIYPSLYKNGTRVKAIFRTLNSHLKNSITVNFRNPGLLNSSSRIGLVATTKKGEVPAYSIQNFTNRFTLTGYKRIYGINKY